MRNMMILGLLCGWLIALALRRWRVAWTFRQSVASTNQHEWVLRMALWRRTGKPSSVRRNGRGWRASRWMGRLRMGGRNGDVRVVGQRERLQPCRLSRALADDSAHL